MAHLTTLPSAVPARHGGRGQKLMKTAREWFRAYTTWRNREVTRAILRGLDDRTLKDIGLHRSEILSLGFDESNRKVRKLDGESRVLRWR